MLLLPGPAVRPQLSEAWREASRAGLSSRETQRITFPRRAVGLCCGTNRELMRGSVVYKYGGHGTRVAGKVPCGFVRTPY